MTISRRSVGIGPRQRALFFAALTTAGPLGHSGTARARAAVKTMLELYAVGPRRVQRRCLNKDRVKQEARVLLDTIIAHAISGTALRFGRRSGYVHWTSLSAIANIGGGMAIDVFKEFSVREKLMHAIAVDWPEEPHARNTFAAEPAFGDLLFSHLFLESFRPGGLDAARQEAESMLASTPFKARDNARRRLERYAGLLVRIEQALAN